MSTSAIVNLAIGIPILLLCLWFMAAWVLSLFTIVWRFAKVWAEGRPWTAEDQRRLDNDTI